MTGKEKALVQMNLQFPYKILQVYTLIFLR